VRQSTRIALQVFAQVFEPNSPVLQLGSYLHLGFGSYTDVRPFFPDEFVGLDIRQGPGVNVVADAQELPMDDATYRTVLALDVLEHLPRPDRAISEARRVLADDGLFVVSVPFDYRLHAFLRITAGTRQAASTWTSSPSRGGPFSRLGRWSGQRTCSPGRDDFDERVDAFRQQVSVAYNRFRARLHLHLTALDEHAHNVGGWMLGRARVGVHHFDPEDTSGAYSSSER
jgi:SAM-dependent methyltransferase